MVSFEQNLVYLLLELPPLEWGVEPSITPHQLKEELNLNLGEKEKEGIASLFLINDIENARAIWLGNPKGPEGNYSIEDLNAHLVGEAGLPPFAAIYFDQYGTTEERLAHFPALLRDYYLFLMQSPFPFIRHWGELALNAREAFALYRGQEGEEEDRFSLFGSLKELFSQPNLKASQLAEQLNHFLFLKVEEPLTENPFSLDRLFAYVIQFCLIHLSLEVTHVRN